VTFSASRLARELSRCGLRIAERKIGRKQDCKKKRKEKKEEKTIYGAPSIYYHENLIFFILLFYLISEAVRDRFPLSSPFSRLVFPHTALK